MYIMSISLPYICRVLALCGLLLLLLLLHLRLIQAVETHLGGGAGLGAALVHHAAMQSSCGQQRTLSGHARGQGPAIGQWCRLLQSV